MLYQLSKNLNRQFFVDFLTAVTRRLAEEGETGELQVVITSSQSLNDRRTNNYFHRKTRTRVTT